MVDPHHIPVIPVDGLGIKSKGLEDASMFSGNQWVRAEPEVQITAVGTLVRFACPRARNAAVLSSGAGKHDKRFPFRIR